MKTKNPNPCVSAAVGACAVLLIAGSATCAFAQTIDPNVPVTQSLKPDILYFNFDMAEATEQDAEVPSGEDGSPATIATGKDAPPPRWIDGPAPEFSKALALDHGGPAPAEHPGESTAGSYLVVPATSELSLAGQSFTMGAWVKVEGDNLPDEATHVIIRKGCDFVNSSPGWDWSLWKRGDSFISVFRTQSGGQDEQLQKFSRVFLVGFRLNEWNHVAVSFDKESKALTFYLNGKVSGQPLTDSAPIGDSPDPVTIGEWLGGGNYGHRFNIAIDDLFITSGVHDFHPAAL